MTFQDELILSVLNEYQGKRLSTEEVAKIISVKNVDAVRKSLDKLTDSHVPVVKTSDGYYSIPRNTVFEYAAGLGIFTAMLSVSLFLF